MDFLNKAADFIELKLDLDVPVKFGKLDENEKAVSILPAPASTNSRAYDKGTTIDYLLQINVKDESHTNAMDVTSKIAYLFEGLPNRAIESSDGSFIFVKSEVYVHPNYVETLEHDQVIYTAIVLAEIEKGGN